ncbi:MAG: dTMP kinase [Candidatus Meridianibacter frigidus]|nr:MAG: dTMP kinase [Candidatus Eremiobacteraeota bacterium]
MFITIEGIEGCGKSTLMEKLANSLRSAGRTVIMAREPGGTSLGDRLRAIFLDSTLRIEPWAEAMLVNTSRAQLLKEVIRPALERREDIVCDRFTDSTIAYQGYGRGLALGPLEQLCDLATAGLRPDLTLFLDISVAFSRARVVGRANRQDRMDSQSDAYHERVREGYRSIAQGNPQRVKTLDGSLGASELLQAALVEISVATQ